MAKRHEHLFQFNGQQISEAAAREAEYHGERLAWWQAEQDTAAEKAKATGIDVREYAVTGGKRVQMVVDSEIQSRLNECGAKIDTHRKARDEYEIHAATYGTQPVRSYELTPDDVIYFRLVVRPRDE